jgi:tricorn protease-like protein
MADFEIEDGIPKIENISQYRIPDKKGVHEFHGFSPDDKEILLTGIAELGKWKGPDIYRINLDTGGSERLTFTPENWDEHAHYTPYMNRIMWVSTSGLNRKRGQIGLDFWEMDGDGKNKQRVTFFNTPDYLNSHNINSVSCADWAWFGSDGRKIIVDVWEDYPVNDKKAVINPGGRTITFPGRRYVMKLIEFADRDGNAALPNDFNEGKYKVKSITTIKEYGKSLDWWFVSIENGPIWQ